MNNSDLYKDSHEPELFSRIAQGDNLAFAEVHALYKARLLYYGKRFLPAWDEVEDIVADTFLVLWQSRQQIRSDIHLKNFLFITVRNKALNAFAFRKRQGKLLENMEIEAPATEDIPDVEMVEGEMLYLLDQAVQTLPKECRRIFELSWDDRREPAEIARILEMNPATVRSQKRRAIQLIQVWIKKNGPAILLLILSTLHRAIFI